MKRLLPIVLSLLLLGCSSSTAKNSDPKKETKIAEVTTVGTTTKSSVATTTKATTVTTTMATTQATTTQAATTQAISTQATTKAAIKYMLNTNTHKFHKMGCSEIEKMKDSSKLISEEPREEIIKAGYSPCGKCTP